MADSKRLRRSFYVWRRRPELSRDSPAPTAPQRDDMPLLEAFDGISEMTSDPESGTGTPEERQRASDEMLADTRHFIDLERSTLFTVEELIFVDE